jgi:hypothetical protein
MSDLKIYRIAGVCSLASIAAFFIEFPFYLVRGSFPPVSNAVWQIEFAARNATNIMTCILLDLVILTLIMVFAAGFRHLIRQADPRHEWLATLFFGVVLVYVILTLVADSLQGATAIDALTPPANGIVIRAMFESMLLMYGSIALWLMALFMALAGYATLATGALPKWSGWVAYLCALTCLAFVPSMFVHHVDLLGFYNPAGLGPEAFASGFPLATWMVVAGILMLRKRGPIAQATPASD